jgi:23S rRNA (guanine745-N1)-methyltransferase
LFEPVSRDEHTEHLVLSPVDIRRAVLMGPNAHHPERLKRLDDIDEPLEVTASFVISEYRRTS